MSAPLITTKLFIPPTRPDFISRPRLIDQLNSGLLRKLTLLSAPAGFGKSSLLSSWAEQLRPATHIAWLSLDERDNDLSRFLTYLAAAFQAGNIEIGNGILAAIQSPELANMDAILAGLLNEIAELSGETALILEDYHLINSQQIDQALIFLLDYSPANMHLIISSRYDPSWPLARLRARGQLLEIRANDLRFTTDESATFFRKFTGLELSTQEVTALEERTEGWITGLQLTALSMKSRDDIQAFISSFTGSNRYILDYLGEEVLSGQFKDVQNFLLQTSILERLTGPLCDAITGKSGGTDTLINLEHSNLFISPLDNERQWYRYHHLFADFLRSNLHQQYSMESIRELHDRASRWHYKERNLEEAMSHTMKAEDYELAAMMIDENLASLFSHSEIPILLGWIEQLPEDIVCDRPWINVHRANTLVLAGRPDEVDPLLENIEKRIEPNHPRRSEILGHAAAVRAYAANLAGDAERATEMVHIAKENLPDEHFAGRGMAAYTMADTYYAQDDLESAKQELQDMYRIGERSSQLMILILAICQLAVIKITQGQLHQAKELYDQAYKCLSDLGGLDSRLRCSYEFGIADLLREWNQLDSAYEHAMIGDEYRKRYGGYLMVGELSLMRILQARGDVNGALDVLFEAERLMKVHRFQLAITVEFKAARVEQWLAAGDIASAIRAAEECNGGSEPEQIALARLHLAQGHTTEVERILIPQKHLAESGGRTSRMLEIMILQSIALKQKGQPEEAIRTLSQVLSLSRPEGFQRVFLDHGLPIYDLLAQISSQDPKAAKQETGISQFTQDYARDLIDAFHREGKIPTEKGDQGLIDPLTDRELEVLQLLAEGLSNKAIAERLVVAPSTIKQHLKNIYGKLDVHNRTQAVARVQELDLI
jgi:LuxR family maltose regulon positive regulatory protein